MIDKWLYTFFGWIDSWFFWVERQFIKPKIKKPKKKKKFKSYITEEQWIKQMLNKK